MSSKNLLVVGGADGMGMWLVKRVFDSVPEIGRITLAEDPEGKECRLVDVLDLEAALQDLAKVSDDASSLSETDAGDACSPCRRWVTSHLEHDLWAECDTGVLRLAKGRSPTAGSSISLPSFAKP